MYCKSGDIKNESDVEQKFLVPLIENSKPMGLGYSNSDFHTKKTLFKRKIGKGKMQKKYVPDYLIEILGLPSVVIEAKSPQEDVMVGYTEARMYAGELNVFFHHEVNPCNKIMASNGIKTLVGYWDKDTPELELCLEDFFVGSEKLKMLIDFLSKESVESSAEMVYKKIRGGAEFHKPTRLLGGNAKDKKIRDNDLGSAITLQYKSVFNPEEMEDRKIIVKNAYISTKKIRKSLDPIRKIILDSETTGTQNFTQIQDSKKPIELIQVLHSPQLKKEVLLLIGNVGSGKSTFVDYIQEVFLPEEIRKKTIWTTLNLNNAPLNRDQIYRWIQEQIIESIRLRFDDLDIDSLEMQEKIYAQELKTFKKSIGELYGDDEPGFRKQLAGKLSSLQQNVEITSRAYTRFFCAQQEKLFILVLDNCDKHNGNDQLLMFDVAKWAKEEYHALIFLPMRDTTYELNKTQAPLDTAIKDLTFRIDPPDLSEVLHRRVEYALSVGPSEISYILENGMVVKCPKSEQKLYLSSIIHSLFDNTEFFRKLIKGVAGRDIRRGIEVFLEFCKSGHIPAIDIFSMRATDGTHTLQPHIIMRALLRKDRWYYADENSYFRNLFVCDPSTEEIPNPFTRILILDYLNSLKGKRGPSGIPGFHKVMEIVANLSQNGLEKKHVYSAITELIKSRCIYAELKDGNKTDLSGEDLIKIAPTGHAHLDLLSNLDYISACSEDVWYKSRSTALRIADRLTSQTQKHLSLWASIMNATDLLEYLTYYYKNDLPAPENYLKDVNVSPTIQIEEFGKTIKSFREKFNFVSTVELQKLYPAGKTVRGTIVSKKHRGYFVEIDSNVVGLIPSIEIRKLPSEVQEQFEIGSSVDVEICEFNETHRKFELKPKTKLGSF